MLKILIVDDSLIIRREIKKFLEALGHVKVYEAFNGKDGLMKYQYAEPDLVTMDITMSGMNGIRTTQAIISEYPNAKILMITSHGQEDMVVDSIKVGASGYILKPITQDSLGKAIGRIFKKYAVNDDDLLDDE